MGKVRVEFVADFGSKRGQTFAGVVVERDYNAILRVALNKLNLKKGKQDMVLVLRDRYTGTRVLSPDSDLEVLLRDGATIVLTTEKPAAHVPKPPRCPLLGSAGVQIIGSITEGDDADDATDSRIEARFEGEWTGGSISGSTLLWNNGKEAPIACTTPNKFTIILGGDVVEAILKDDGKLHWSDGDVWEQVASNVCRHKSQSTCAAPLPQLFGLENLGDMHGPWAVLQGNVLPLVRRAISETHGFQEKCMGDYIAFDYHAGNASQLPDMFPNPETLSSRGDARRLAAVRRECRGLLVSTHGEVLARRLPKFFNIDEVEETKMENLPQTEGIATQKLDGSLVSPFFLNGEIRWAGKAAISPSVEKHAAQTSLNGIVAKVLEQRCTPIFEWCEVGPPVGVMTHRENRLTLIAVRDNTTGAFWEDRQVRSLGCEVVDAVPFDDLPRLLQDTRSKLGAEGVVVRWFGSGRMVKLKTLWWITLSGSQKKAKGRPARALLDALEAMPLSSIPPPLIWQAVLDGDDDQMSLVYGSLTPETQRTLRAFAAASQQGIIVLDQELREWAECAREATEADLERVAGGWPASLLASYHRRAASAERELRKLLLKMAGSGQMSCLEALVGTHWEGSQQIMEFCGHLGTFEKAPVGLKDHVLSTYLPRKLEDFTGFPVSEDSLINVARLYEPSEGKIKGLWEQFLSDGIIDLRVDLQPRDKVFSFHNGDTDFAHWQVQFGPNDNCSRSTKAREGDRKGAFAGVLMRTGVDVEFSLIHDAFKLSFESQKVVRIDPSPSRITHIFLDLDGVLVDFDAGFADVVGSPKDQQAKRWQHIENTPGFYNMLPWIESARRLWNHVRGLSVPTTILTGIPEGKLGERSAIEKREWVARELGDVEVITCLSREKPSFSGMGRLLIDDRPQQGWETVGGRQITHRSTPDTLLALTDMGLGRDFAVLREDISVVTGITEELRIARQSAEIVALDAEWPPDRAGATPKKAAVLQLAFRPCSTFRAFVIDLTAWDHELEDFIRELLASELPKLIFGSGDQERLQMRIEAAIDLQEDSQSLAAQARKSGLLLQKSKQLQAADWSLRPLRDEQIVYAGTDAAVLLELDGGRAAGKVRNAAPSAGRNASVEFVGVFLTPDSKKKLLRRMPPQYQEVVADHMTLVWMPQSIKGLSVGSNVKLEVTGKGQDEKVQAVSVVTNETQPRSGHITISHKQDAVAVDANNLQFDIIESFSIDGVVGVSVITGVAETQTLPQQILDRVVALTDGQPGESDRFDNITDSQRHAMHLLAEEYGLEHRSEGKKNTTRRKLILTVPKRYKKPHTRISAQCGERTVVKDAKKFAAIFGDVPGLRLHGRVTRTGICWQLGVALPGTFERLVTHAEQGQWRDDDRIVVIMRGFPGSGKSYVASWLRKQTSIDLASADEFFTDAVNIQDAHDKCRQRFLESLEAKRSVIVDNTNVQKREYAFYKSRAEAEGYEVVILELICESTKELERFRGRSIHGVDGGKAGSMWARWEQDPSALRLAPYEHQELMAWLTERGMVGHPPNTHLIMPSGPFLSVTSARSEFHKLHAAEWGRNYISELGQPHAFQMFFDIDGLDFDVLLSAIAKLRPLVDDADMVISGFEGPPPGYHVFVVGKVVDSAAAFHLCHQWLEAAPELGNHVDEQLYRNPQLRLLGSRKISKDGVDLGRVHDPLGRFDADGWHEGGKWEWREMSIHIL